MARERKTKDSQGGSRSHGSSSQASSSGTGANKKRLSLMTAEGGKAALVRRMQQINDELQDVKQEERPQGLSNTARDLASSAVMQHKDRDVRLLAACCLCDVLRIYAPDAPYEQDQLRQIFGLLLTQLGGLSSALQPSGASARTARILYILRSLAKVKSCIILVELARQGVEGADEDLEAFFSTLLNGIRPEHSQEVHDLIVEALGSCLDEIDDFTQGLLDTLLQGLFVKKEAPRTYQLVKSLLTRDFNRLCLPISTFVNGELAGQQSNSELSDRVFPLVYELHKVDANFLLYMLPTVAQQLQSEDTVTRKRAIALLGRLFISSHAEYGVQFARNWREFVGRFKDVDAEIRQQMVTIGVAMLPRKPALRGELQAELILRLSDASVDVRKTAVEELCDMAMETLSPFSTQLLKEIGGRVRDRKLPVRGAAMRGLARVYAKHVSKGWVDSMQSCLDVKSNTATLDDLAVSPPRDEIQDKLGWVPELVLKCYSYHEPEMKSMVLMLLDDVLLPRKASESVRAAGLVYMYSGLDAGAKQALKVILEHRKRCQVELRGFIEARAAWKNAPDDAAKAKAEQKSFSQLLEVCPTPAREKKDLLLKKLNECKDQKVFKMLSKVCDESATTKEVYLAKEEVVKCVGSKTQLASFLDTVIRHAGLLSGGKESMPWTLAICKAAVDAGDDGMAVEALGLMEAEVAVFPRHLGGALERVADLLTAAREQAEEGGGGRQDDDDAHDITNRVLQLMARAEASSGPVPEELRDSLKNIIVREGNAPQAGRAVAALRAVLGNADEQEREEVVGALLQQLTAARLLSVKNKRLLPLLGGLAAVARNFPDIFKTKAEKVRCFVMNEVLKSDGKEEDDDAESNDSISSDGDDDTDDPSTLGKKKSKGKGKGSAGGKNRQKAAASSESVALIVAALELLVSWLLPFAEETCQSAAATGRGKVGGGEDEDEDEDGGDEGSDTLGEVKNVLDVMFGILDSGGEAPNGARLEESDMAQLRLLAASAVLKLMRNRSKDIQAFLPPTRWHSLAWTLLDENNDVRGGFTREVCQGVVRGLPMRFLAFLSLVGAEQEATRKYAKKAFLARVERLRMTYEARSEALSRQEKTAVDGEGGGDGSASGSTSVDGDSTSGGSGSSKDKQGALVSFMPENVLPYVVHLLAYHPDFPMSHKDEGRVRRIQKYLRFVFECLCHGHGGGSAMDNVSFLLQMLDKIGSGSYCDVLDEGTEKIELVAQLATDVLTRSITRQDSLAPYPGTIFVPKDLFKAVDQQLPSRQQQQQQQQRRTHSPGTPAADEQLGGDEAGDEEGEDMDMQDMEDGVVAPSSPPGFAEVSPIAKHTPASGRKAGASSRSRRGSTAPESGSEGGRLGRAAPTSYSPLPGSGSKRRRSSRLSQGSSNVSGDEEEEGDKQEEREEDEDEEDEAAQQQQQQQQQRRRQPKKRARPATGKKAGKPNGTSAAPLGLRTPTSPRGGVSGVSDTPGSSEKENSVSADRRGGRVLRIQQQQQKQKQQPQLVDKAGQGKGTELAGKRGEGKAKAAVREVVPQSEKALHDQQSLRHLRGSKRGRERQQQSEQERRGEHMNGGGALDAVKAKRGGGRFDGVGKRAKLTGDDDDDDDDDDKGATTSGRAAAASPRRAAAKIAPVQKGTRRSPRGDGPATVTPTGPSVAAAADAGGDSSSEDEEEKAALAARRRSVRRRAGRT